MQNCIPLPPTKPPAIPVTKTRAIPAAAKPRRRQQWRSADDNFLLATRTPTLRFSPTAWAKLLFWRDYSETEVGGFGLTATDDLLYVEDVALVEQACTGMSVAFNDEAVADFFDRQVDAGRKIEQFARLWMHSHPGVCPQPSSTDEDTFLRVFGKNDWAVMFILAQEGQTYARLQFGVGPGGSLMLPVAVDYSRPFSGSDYGVWEQEYQAHVQEAEWLPYSSVSEPKLAGLFHPPRNSAVLADGYRSPLDEELWEDFLEFEEGRHGA